MDKPFSFETFLRILENDDYYAVDETSFYFDDDPEEKDRMLGCLRKYDKPYWVGNCDIPTDVRLTLHGNCLTQRYSTAGP